METRLKLLEKVQFFHRTEVQLPFIFNTFAIKGSFEMGLSCSLRVVCLLEPTLSGH